MSNFTSEDYEETADLLRLAKEEDIGKVCNARLSIVLSALDFAATGITDASMSQWQDIETAPQDEGRILVAERPNVTCYQVSWRGWFPGDDYDDREICWREVGNGRKVNPTRWMAIPLDPTNL